LKCPECQFENREGVNFCEECGAAFELECPACKSKIPSGRKYCGECGYKLESTDKTFSDVSELEDPPSPIATNKIYSDVTPITGERKHVTAMFSDLTGYTALSERMDPEEVKDITTQLFDKIARIVGKYDGFIEKYVGDAVMALFGAKEAHEDDPVRAIKAAKEIHNVVNSLSPKYDEIIEQPLSMHTGINTGLVITGDINLEKGTHGVAGDTLNVAARLSGLGNANDILVGQNTFHQAEGFFEFNELDPAVIKGKAEPIKAYKVLSPKGKPIKIHRLHGLRADLIGRKVEMSQLASALQRLTEDKKGSVVTICGAAGTGKSRLVEEFRSSLKLDNLQWLEGHAYPYSQNIPYYPIIDLLNKTLEIDEGDSSEMIREKIQTGISELIGKNTNLIPYIGSLFSISYPEIEEVSPEFWKKQLQEAFQSVLASLSQRGPMIICFEDLHWADPSFLELIRTFLSELRNPIFILCTHRPIISLFTSHQIDSMSVSYHEIRLQDLSLSESQVMVESLLITDEIPSELQRFVQDKIEGNPFYIEEVINSLIDSETLFRENDNWQVKRQINESDISSTIHGVISGRLDRLENDTKRILQEASVIGRSFLYEILKRITELKGQIDKCLSGLERLDLIKTRTVQPDLEYIFKHALTQEVVYNGLLKKERRAIHEQIGLVIEQLFQDRLPEFYETLAFHFKNGLTISKAIKYLIKSGEKCLKKYAVQESHEHYKEAYNLIKDKKSKTEEERELLFDLLNKWSLVYYYSGDFNELTDLLRRHQSEADNIKDKEKQGMFYGWLGFILHFRMELTDAYRYLKKSLKIGEEANNQRVIGYACTWLTYACAVMDKYEEGYAYWERAVEIAETIENDHYLYFKSLTGIGLSYWQKGDSKKLGEIGKGLLEYGQRHGNIRSQTMGHFGLGGAYNLVGDHSMSIKCFQKAFEVSADTMYDTVAKTYMGLGYILNDQVQEAEAPLKEVVSFYREYDFDWAGMPAQVYLGVVIIAKGNMSQGLKMIEDALKTFIREERKYFIALTEHIIGKIYSQIVEGAGPISPLSIAKNIGFLVKNVPFADKKAESHFNKAIEVAKEIGAKSLLGPLYLDLGLLHKAKKRTDKARECLSEAIQIFEQCEAEVYLKQAKEVLGSL